MLLRGAACRPVHGVPSQACGAGPGALSVLALCVLTVLLTLLPPTGQGKQGVWGSLQVGLGSQWRGQRQAKAHVQEPWVSPQALLGEPLWGEQPCIGHRCTKFTVNPKPPPDQPGRLPPPRTFRFAMYGKPLSEIPVSFLSQQSWQGDVCSSSCCRVDLSVPCPP